MNILSTFYTRCAKQVATTSLVTIYLSFDVEQVGSNFKDIQRKQILYMKTYVQVFDSSS
jgi:hypothetical protein